MRLVVVVVALGAACGPEQPAEVAEVSDTEPVTVSVPEPSASTPSSADATNNAAAPTGSATEVASAGNVGSAVATAEPSTTAPVPIGRLPTEVIQKQARRNFGRVRTCYEMQLKNDPHLQGRVVVRFTINPDGSVGGAKAESTDMKDATLLQCIEKAFAGLSFPAPEGGKVNVTYPLALQPGD